MPIYEYACQKCQKEFEELILGGQTDIHCPACDSGEVKRLLSVAAIKTSSGFVSTGASAGGCSGCHGGSCAGCK
jgi:putative FmdB family regulatory protein